MNTGTYISGIAHLALIAWLLFGGVFMRHAPPAAPTVSEVSIITEAEYVALVAAAPAPATSPEVPQQPAVAAPQTPPPARPATEPPVEATPEPTPPAPPVEVPMPTPPVIEPPRPRPVDRVAPVPTEAPPPEATIAETRQDAVVPDAEAEADRVEEAQEATAPQEATSQIITEAVKTDDTSPPAPPMAPATSAPPKARPERPAPPTPAQTAPAQTAASDAIADALASAMAEGGTGTGGQGTAPSGPPLTAGEKDGLRIAVQQCWNVGSLSTDALRVTVTVAVSLGQDGRPDAGSIRMLGYEGGSEGPASQAFEAARRAIVRCGANGFNLPAEKYDQWREIEMVFNPERMRIK